MFQRNVKETNDPERITTRSVELELKYPAPTPGI